MSEDAIWGGVAIWTIGMVLAFTWGGSVRDAAQSGHATDGTRLTEQEVDVNTRWGARMMLCSPVWPIAAIVLAIWWLIRGLVTIFRDAFPRRKP